MESKGSCCGGDSKEEVKGVKGKCTTCGDNCKCGDNCQCGDAEKSCKTCGDKCACGAKCTCTASDKSCLEVKYTGIASIRRPAPHFEA